jgi:hypothetical protein
MPPLKKMVLSAEGFSSLYKDGREDDAIGYIQRNNSIQISPTRLNNILVRLLIQKDKELPDFLFVYFFQFPAAYQRFPVHIEQGDTYVDVRGNENEFWGGKPFIVDSIGFGAPHLKKDMIFAFEIMHNAMSTYR